MLRTRVLPATVHRRSVLASPLCINPQQTRQSSTAQDLRTYQANVRESAMLHGKSKGGEASNGTKKSSIEPASQGPSLQPTSARNQKNLSPTNIPGMHKREPSRPFKIKSVKRAKREAEEHTQQRPARRRATQSLKDEAYIRNNFPVPTSKEYPSLPPGFFKNMKSSVVAAVQNLAQLRTEYKRLAGDAKQCILYFESAATSEIVIGEGRTEVR